MRWSEDGKGNRTNYSYDASGNLTLVDPPGSAVGNTRYEYDGLSRPLRIWDGKCQKRVLSYDKLDRVTKVELYRDACGGAHELMRTDTYTYDENGNRTSRSDPTGTTSDAYDALNRLTETTLPGARTILYSYDESSNLAAITHAGEQVRYAYFKDNLVKSVEEPGGNCGSSQLCTTFTYDDDHQRTQTTYPNGVSQAQTFDPAGRVKTIKATKGTDVLTDFSYRWTRQNDQGQTEERDLLDQATDNRLGTTTDYRYDTLNRLRLADRSVVGGDWEYAYDNASNRTKKRQGSSWTSYAYDEANQLCWAAPGELADADRDCVDTPAGRTTYTHDQNGNLTGSSAGMALAYNVANQTSSITPAAAARRSRSSTRQMTRTSAPRRAQPTTRTRCSGPRARPQAAPRPATCATRRARSWRSAQARGPSASTRCSTSSARSSP